jgi:tetratricopeptide (TPR) repeat protein
VADLQRLEDLRRRVQRDPASLAFAQLAEECRRAGQCQEAVRVCREGLAHHPDYLSARVTLGRALLGLGHLDQASAELSGVLRTAPENLAALRGLAEVFHQRGLDAEALNYYRAALALAPHDPELVAAVESLERPAATAMTAPAGPIPAGSRPAMNASSPTCSEDGPLGLPSSASGSASARRTTPVIARLERWLQVIEARRGRQGRDGDARP